MAKSAPTATTGIGEHLGASLLTDDLSFLLARANARSISAGNAALSEHGLRARSYSVLALAAGDTRPTQRELAEFLWLDPSQVVALVDDLEGRGLVRREPDPNDRRAKVVLATEEGRNRFTAAQVSARSAELDQHGNLTAAQRGQLGALLREIAFSD